MFLGHTENEYGVKVSKHRCDTCGDEFTICPAPYDQHLDNWDHCLAESCPSYDPERDVDALFERCDPSIRRLPRRDH